MTPSADRAHAATDQADGEASPRSAEGGPVPPGRPIDPQHQSFDEGAPGRLAEQRPLTDAEGDDIREYTGEPVETEDGWVVPVQQNVGPGSEAGGGEHPDPPRPPEREGPSDGDAG